MTNTAQSVALERMEDEEEVEKEWCRETQVGRCGQTSEALRVGEVLYCSGEVTGEVEGKVKGR